MSDRTALIGDIQKFSTEDGPGIRTTVFIKGCPLNCRWCHNPEMISYEQEIIRLPNSCIGCGYCVEHCPKQAIYVIKVEDGKGGFKGQIEIDREKCDRCMKCTETCYSKALRPVAKVLTAEEVMAKVQQDKGFYDHTGGGMTISGGEMLSHPDFSEELIELARERDIKVCLDTSGQGDGNKLMELAKHDNVSNILFDMKAIDSKAHEELTGHPNDIILDNLVRLARDPETHDKIMMRMPLIHGINDTDEMIKKTGEFYKAHNLKNVTLLPYHNLGVSKSRNVGKLPEEFVSPSDERLSEIKEYFEKECGMKVEILGRQTR